MDDPKAALFLNEGACGYGAGDSIFEINLSYPRFLPAGEDSLGELGYFLPAIALEKTKGTIVPWGLFKLELVWIPDGLFINGTGDGRTSWLSIFLTPFGSPSLPAATKGGGGGSKAAFSGGVSED